MDSRSFMLAYDQWSVEEKRKELYRVIEAMSYQPGDEKLARKFSLPHPDMDPRVYADWMEPAKALSKDGQWLLELLIDKQRGNLEVVSKTRSGST